MFKIGSLVKIRIDNADTAKVLAGWCGIVEEHPNSETFWNSERNKANGYVAVRFKNLPPVNGAYGPDFAIFLPHNLELLWKDEDLFEDVT